MYRHFGSSRYELHFKPCEIGDGNYRLNTLNGSVVHTIGFVYSWILLVIRKLRIKPGTTTKIIRF